MSSADKFINTSESFVILCSPIDSTIRQIAQFSPRHELIVRDETGSIERKKERGQKEKKHRRHDPSRKFGSFPPF